MEKRRALRPVLTLGRRLRPQFAFVGRRLTPGDLGLELTTLLAALSVGLFIVIAYWSVISGDPGPTPGDQTALNVAHDLQASWLTTVAKGFTDLGSGWVTWPIAALAAVALAATRRWLEFWVLIIGMATTILLVHGIKMWTDRPRPADALVSTTGPAFPSGHAAYSTLYVWLAVTLALRLVPGITKRSLVIGAGILVAAVVGLTRVYLRAHWLSDVTSGWALGLSCFSAVAIVALIVSYIRHNPRRHERAPQLDPGAGAGAGN
jgi:undecaprenyl-diphosphatase